METAGNASRGKKEASSRKSRTHDASKLAMGQQTPVEAALSLAAADQTFASLLDVLNPTFYRCETSPPWRMSFVSKGVEGLTGHPAGDFPDLDWQELMHPADVAPVEQAVDRAVADGNPFCVTYRLYHASGELRWVREQGQAVQGPHGKPLFLVGMITDITNEQRLRESGEEANRHAMRQAEELAKVLESTTDCIYSLNYNWHFTYLNSNAERELSSAGQLLGKHVLEVAPHVKQTAFWEVFERVMECREPERLEEFMPGLDHWYEGNVAPTQDGITVFFRNIDDRKRAEREAEKRESQLQRTLDQIPQMVWSTLPDGSHDYYNRLWYEFTGGDERTTHGDGWSSMFHPDDRARAWTAWRKSLRMVVAGQKFRISLFGFKAKRAATYLNRSEGVLFVVNGQTHGTLSPQIFTRSKVGLDYVADSLMVSLDCSELSRTALEELFMNSRESLAKSEFRTAVERELEDVLNHHPLLREFNNRRREELRVLAHVVHEQLLMSSALMWIPPRQARFRGAHLAPVQ